MNGALFGALLTGREIHLKNIIFNSTDCRSGLAFRFQITENKDLLIGNPLAGIGPKNAANLRLGLSGHFKTGQRWSLQNRPTGMARDGVVLPLWDWTRQARFSPPTPRAAFEDVAVMEQPVQHGCDGGAITQ